MCDAAQRDLSDLYVRTLVASLETDADRRLIQWCIIEGDIDLLNGAALVSIAMPKCSDSAPIHASVASLKEKRLFARSKWGTIMVSPRECRRRVHAYLATIAAGIDPDGDTARSK